MMQTVERFDAFGRICISTQQRVEIDTGEFGDQMRKSDETAHHAMAVESVREMRIPRPTEDVALVPISACIGIEQRPQALAIELRVSGRSRLAEELPEVG